MQSTSSWCKHCDVVEPVETLTVAVIVKDLKPLPQDSNNYSYCSFLGFMRKIYIEY